ncbi:hypothetical protein C4K39_2715 [Pseudomonas sessilinigenes]|nr:hypothetical protein C4K39_2715 [Pseudomonas sessilinigenes]
MLWGEQCSPIPFKASTVHNAPVELSAAQALQDLASRLAN